MWNSISKGKEAGLAAGSVSLKQRRLEGSRSPGGHVSSVGEERVGGSSHSGAGYCLGWPGAWEGCHSPAHSLHIS